MKYLINTFLIIVLTLYSPDIYSVPNFSVKAANFNYVSPSILEFDIYIIGNIYFGLGQFILDFNPAVANGGTLEYIFATGINVTDFPNDPYIKSSVVGTQLRFYAGTDHQVTDSINGLKVRRMRLTTTAASFSGTFNDIGLTWNTNSGPPLFKTKVFYGYYTCGCDYYPANLTGSSIQAAKLEMSWDLQVMQVRDTMRVYLRNSSSPFALADSSIVYPVLFSGYFKGILTFSKTETAYYVVAKHRNSLETWSAAPVIINLNTAYNFASSISQAYGNNMIIADSNAAFYSGDVNYNGFVDLDDVLDIYNDQIKFETGYDITDLNGNNSVELNDELTAYNNSISFVRLIRP